MDYGSGGGGIIVYASSRAELEEALNVKKPGRDITIIEDAIDEHPFVIYKGDSIGSYDLVHPNGSLKTLLEQSW